MAFVSTFFCGETASLMNKLSSSSSFFRLPLPCSPANLQMARTVTVAASPKTTESGQRELRGIMKPKRVSPEMQAVVGVPEISRTQALKHIWSHIKEHNLQDPENKKIIVCDDKLKKIFGGKERVGFLEIAGLISPHFLK